MTNDSTLAFAGSGPDRTEAANRRQRVRCIVQQLMLVGRNGWTCPFWLR